MPLDDLTLARLVVDQVRSHAIISLDLDGVITGWAAGAEDITGWSRADMVGRSLPDLFTEADRAARMPELEIATALAEGRAEDSRWHPRRDGTLFWANGATVHLEGRSQLVKIFRDETRSKQADEHRVLLLNELNHRVKNTLATVQSVADQTLRLANVSPGVRADLSERLVALSRAHNVLVEENWAGAEVRALICEVLKAYERDPSPIRLDGPTVRLHPSQAVAVSLTCHELATNAAKYGALGTADGRVSVTWNVAHNGAGARFLSLLWEESGGPTVRPPERKGFGSRLISQTFAGESGGRAEVTYDSGGIRCAMALALVDEGTSARGSPADPVAATPPPPPGGDAAD